MRRINVAITSNTKINVRAFRLAFIDCYPHVWRSASSASNIAEYLILPHQK